MLNDIDPMAIAVVLVVVAVVGSVIGVARRGRTAPARDPRALPAGAEAALWSVTEVLPDPRNHLAIKDPTSQLRLTASERAGAATLGTAPAPRPAEAARTAQSLAARRAALAKRRGAAVDLTAPEAAPAPEPTIVLGDDAPEPHLLLTPDVLAAPGADVAAVAPRWGEISRAS